VGETVSPFREPDAGNLPVRFDEREQETGPGQTGLRLVRRKLLQLTTGRLQSLRLFSTLLSGVCWKLKQSERSSALASAYPSVGRPYNSSMNFKMLPKSCV